MESFIGKIETKRGEGKVYANPLQDITDIVGIRIITFYREDIPKIQNIIENEFDIDRENTVDKMLPPDIDRFGYQSFHYVVSLNDARRSLTEWSKFKGFKAEIQLRTILQHAWAAIDHKLRYKTNEEAPSVLRRKLFRLSALLEIADDEYSELKRQSEALRKEIRERLEKGEKGIEINLDSLRLYITTSKSVKRTKEMAEEIGFEIEDLTSFDRILGAILNQVGIETIDALDCAFGNEEKLQKVALEALYDKAKGQYDYLSLQGILIFVLLYMRKDTIRKEELIGLTHDKGIEVLFFTALGLL